MWVSVVPGFDPSGLQVTKWRESFQRHGVLVGQWMLGEEEVKELRRRCLVARLLVDGVDVPPPWSTPLCAWPEARPSTFPGFPATTC